MFKVSQRKLKKNLKQNLKSWYFITATFNPYLFFSSLNSFITNYQQRYDLGTEN